MASWVLHVDMDQFIAAVELLRRPELRGRPVVVGGEGDPTKRGVVSTASYEARAYGVHSGQPLRTAARRCPDAVFLPVDKAEYEAASARVMAALRELPGSVVEVLGWDEAFVAVDSDDPEAVAHEIRRRIREATNLSCSVGIGHNKLQAKLATGFGKPGGVYQITAETWLPTMGERSPDALWGIGAKTAKRLATLGITTVRQLATADREELARQVGPNTGPWLIDLARGRVGSPVTDVPYIARSRSIETTFQVDLTDWREVVSSVGGLARQLANAIAEERRVAMRVVVKVRFAPFTTRTHGETLPAASAEPEAIAAAALTALDRFTTRRPVRLLGVRAEFAPPA